MNLSNSESTGKNQFERQFYNEIGKSKRLRAAILIGLLGFEGIFLLLIYLLFSDQYMTLFQTNLAIYAVLIFVLIIITYESIVHYFIRRHRKYPEYVIRISGYLNAFSEVSLLSILLVFIIISSKQTIILHSPAALTYFIFIILSTLRLDFKLSVFTGTLAAAEYVLISLLCSMKLGITENMMLSVTPIQFLGQGLTMITAGIAAGFVANLIKKKMRISFNYIEEKNEVIDLFGQQISPQIANEILKNPTELKGTRKKVCVMFLDIRNFTPYVEHKEPEEVVAYLNSLFGFMIEIVQSHHGIINQFLGDGFMSTFGAPISDGNICKDAVESAMEIIDKTNSDAKNGHIAPSRIGIGLHYGEAVTGNVGSNMRKQYSITGSVVIIASRIEQLTKEYKSDLLVSKEVFYQLDEKTRKHLSPIGPVMVKGRETPISLYGLTSQI